MISTFCLVGGIIGFDAVYSKRVLNAAVNLRWFDSYLGGGFKHVLFFPYLRK